MPSSPTISSDISTTTSTIDAAPQKPAFPRKRRFSHLRQAPIEPESPEKIAALAHRKIEELEKCDVSGEFAKDLSDNFTLQCSLNESPMVWAMGNEHSSTTAKVEQSLIALDLNPLHGVLGSSSISGMHLREEAHANNNTSPTAPHPRATSSTQQQHGAPLSTESPPERASMSSEFAEITTQPRSHEVTLFEHMHHQQHHNVDTSESMPHTAHIPTPPGLHATQPGESTSANPFVRDRSEDKILSTNPTRIWKRRLSGNTERRARSALEQMRQRESAIH